MLFFLVYHKVADTAQNQKYTISPRLFESHLHLIKRSGIDVINPREMSETWPASRTGIVLSFDDGTIDHFETVHTLLNRFGIYGLFYVPTAKLERSGRLSREQLRILFDRGHTIGSHAHSHQKLDSLSRTQQLEEMEQSYTIIESLTGVRPLHFAPPGGFYDRDVHDVARRIGYRFFRTMRWGYNSSFDPLQIEVIPVARILDQKLLQWILRGKGERVLHFFYGVKNMIRTVVPNATTLLLQPRRASTPLHDYNE